VDQAGIAFYNALRDVNRLEDERDKIVRAGRKPTRWRLRVLTIDGWMVERWFVKTALNLAATARSEYTWGSGERAGDDPPSALVAPLFGDGELPDGLGLYSARFEGRASNEPCVDLGALAINGRVFAGLMLAVRGWPYVVRLTPALDFAAISPLPGLDKNVRLYGFSYHPGGIKFYRGKSIGQRIDFCWKRRPRAGTAPGTTG
jgi:hypothetical protein